MSKTFSWDFRSTRYHGGGVEILYRQDAARLWRCYARQDGGKHATGPQFATKEELFAGLPEVAESWGFEK